MTTTTYPVSPVRPHSLETGWRILAEAARTSPMLAAITLILVFAMAPTLAAMALDPRLHLGINVWIKPLKFEIALAIYTATLAIFARWLPMIVRQARWFRAYVALCVGAIIYEMVWIAAAAAFGVGSHFNVASPLTMWAYVAAGVGAVTLTSLSAVFGIAIARNRETGLPALVRNALSTGLVLTFVMTVITAGYMSSQMSHFVGGNGADTEAWRLMGWATDGGDLRVAHFFASHAMHALPILGLAGTAFVPRRYERPYLVSAAILYAGFVAYTFVEATMGRPFLSWLF